MRVPSPTSYASFPVGSACPSSARHDDRQTDRDICRTRPRPDWPLSHRCVGATVPRSTDDHQQLSVSAAAATDGKITTTTNQQPTRPALCQLYPSNIYFVLFYIYGTYIYIQLFLFPENNAFVVFTVRQGGYCIFLSFTGFLPFYAISVNHLYFGFTSRCIIPCIAARVNELISRGRSVPVGLQRTPAFNLDAH